MTQGGRDNHHRHARDAADSTDIEQQILAPEQFDYRPE